MTYTIGHSIFSEFTNVRISVSVIARVIIISSTSLDHNTISYAVWVARPPFHPSNCTTITYIFPGTTNLFNSNPRVMCSKIIFNQNFSLASFGSANLPPFLWQSMTACEKLLLVLEKKNHFPFSFLQPFDFGHIPANNEMKQNK